MTGTDDREPGSELLPEVMFLPLAVPAAGGFHDLDADGAALRCPVDELEHRRPIALGDLSCLRHVVPPNVGGTLTGELRPESVSTFPSQC